MATAGPLQTFGERELPRTQQNKTTQLLLSDAVNADYQRCHVPLSLPRDNQFMALSASY